MKSFLFALMGVFGTLFLFGAEANNDSKLIELGKAYKDFMFRNDPPKSYLKSLKKDASDDLKQTAKFIAETINPRSKVLSDGYLKLPNEVTLKAIYIVRQISLNLKVEEPKDNINLVSELKNASINHYELVDNYYSMLFTTVGNKLGLKQLGKMDFQLKRLNLNDETEKGVFFLRCMSLCGRSIWGYMNVSKPRNTKLALVNIDNFPMFNGLKYYQYTDFYFSDFSMELNGEPGSESYKYHFVNQLYETLIYHMICLREEGAENAEINDLLLGSIMPTENLYKYTEHTDVLKKIFKKKE
ncbi:MAG: hypothetical protein JXQ87_06110 [Bacteroidia bacterium]